MNARAILILVACPALYALTQALLKRVGKAIPPFMTMAISMFVLFLISLAVSLAHERAPFSAAAARDIAIVVLAGALNVVAFWVLLKGFDVAPLWQQQLFALLTPVFGAIYAYFLLGEAISWNLFFGLGIMSVGLYVALR